MVLALVLFLIMYVILLSKPDVRWITALVFAGIFVVLGILPVNHVIKAVNWNVILMLTGTMIVVEMFIESLMPMRLAELLLKKVSTVQWAVVVLALFAGVISAFVDNVAHCGIQQPAGCGNACR